MPSFPTNVSSFPNNMSICPKNMSSCPNNMSICPKNMSIRLLNELSCLQNCLLVLSIRQWLFYKKKSVWSKEKYKNTCLGVLRTSLAKAI